MDNWAAVEIADALVTAINAETWAEEFTAVRRYAPVRQVQDGNCPTVTVLPFETANPRLQDRRIVVKEDVTVSINVQKGVSGPECNEEIDPLTKLVQDIAAFVRTENTRLVLSGDAHATFQSAEIAFDFAGLRDPVVFVGWTNISFLVVRP